MYTNLLEEDLIKLEEVANTQVLEEELNVCNQLMQVSDFSTVENQDDELSVKKEVKIKLPKNNSLHDEVQIIYDNTSSKYDKSISKNKNHQNLIFENKEIKQISFSGIVSESPRMQKVFQILEKVAKTNSTILILGESGTGKELIAKAAHKLSGRTGKLIPVNCGAIPEDLLESELFGHEKGSFTGATSTKQGRFQIADNGTIFLDEIGEMSPKLQVKLLRVLQEKVIEPVGSNKSIHINVRVIAATHKDLKEEIKKGKFREDLYYRLQVVPIELPPLRDRGMDAFILAQYFMERDCLALQKDTINISDEVKNIILSYRWEGNIRELENFIQRLAILVDEPTIQLEHLPDYMCQYIPLRSNIESFKVGSITDSEDFPEEGIDFNYLIDTYETNLITKALQKSNWNKKAAAKLLNINRTTLVEKIKKKRISCISDDATSEREELLEEFNN